MSAIIAPEDEDIAMQVPSNDDWRLHRLAVLGDEHDLDGFVRMAMKRSTTAWGSSDALFRRLRPMEERNASLHDMIAELDAILSYETGYSFEDVVAQMDAADRLVFQSREALVTRIRSLKPIDEMNGFSVEISRPGFSLSSVCPVPHSVASLGLEPVGRLWRKDNWGVDTEVIGFGQIFRHRQLASMRYRFMQFAAHGSMPASAFHRMSKRFPGLVFLMVGQMTGTMTAIRQFRETGSSPLNFAVYAWCAGEHVSSNIVDLSGAPGMMEAFSSEPEANIEVILESLESDFMSKLSI